MATEYVEGRDAGACGARPTGPVPAERLRGSRRAWRQAIAAMHDAGVVHRDLKPANVVLAWSGPKLIDFGIAKQEGSDRPDPDGSHGGFVALDESRGDLRRSRRGARATSSPGACAWRMPGPAARRSARGTRMPSPSASVEEPDLQGPSRWAGWSSSPRRCRRIRRLGRVGCTTQLRLAGSGAAAPAMATAVACRVPVAAGPGPSPRRSRRCSGRPHAARGEPPEPSQPERRRPAALAMPLAVLALLLIAAGVASPCLSRRAAARQCNPPPSPSTSVDTEPSPSSSSPPDHLRRRRPARHRPRPRRPWPRCQRRGGVMAADYTPYQNTAASGIRRADQRHPRHAHQFRRRLQQLGVLLRRQHATSATTRRPEPGARRRSRTQNTITLELHDLRAERSHCCPTGGIQAVRYNGTGKTLTPLDPIPGEDPTQNHR